MFTTCNLYFGILHIPLKPTSLFHLFNIIIILISFKYIIRLFSRSLFFPSSFSTSLASSLLVSSLSHRALINLMCYLVSASSSFCFNELCSLIEYSVTLRPVRSLVPVSRFTCFEGGWPDIMSGYLGKRPVPETCKSVFSLICVFKRFLTF